MRLNCNEVYADVVVAFARITSLFIIAVFPDPTGLKNVYSEVLAAVAAATLSDAQIYSP
jgi:hypothetical protein